MHIPTTYGPCLPHLCKVMSLATKVVFPRRVGRALVTGTWRIFLGRFLIEPNRLINLGLFLIKFTFKSGQYFSRKVHIILETCVAFRSILKSDRQPLKCNTWIYNRIKVTLYRSESETAMLHSGKVGEIEVLIIYAYVSILAIEPPFLPQICFRNPHCGPE